MKNGNGLRVVKKVALIGSYMPRLCGIATFTSDLRNSLASEYPGVEFIVVAVSDPGGKYVYPPEVQFEIDQDDLGSYRKAAEFLNASDVDLVCVQHEFGIFGGEAGEHILFLLKRLRMPIVVTLHTILKAPSPYQQAVLSELVGISSRAIVMSKKGGEIIRHNHQVPSYKLKHIPHGVPCAASKETCAKRKAGLETKKVLLTFGLLSPDKGIENMIEALPKIVKEEPDAVYLVVGATHPHVRAAHGEAYREKLTDLAESLGVKDHLLFDNRFVDLDELTCLLGMADIYVTPYLKAEQITSGTLAYAVGTGKAVISTPYWYAEELLAENRGILVPFRDPEALAAVTVELLKNDAKRHLIQENARALGADMAWPRVATQYMREFNQVALEQTTLVVPAFGNGSPQRKRPAPALNLTHLRRMTDNTGMLQHAIYSVPRYQEGYCLDDNARALIAAVEIGQSQTADSQELNDLATTYLAFVQHALDPQTGLFRNFMSFERHWLENRGSEDSHGRALWALGTAARKASEPGVRALSKELFRQALNATFDFTSPRAWAFTLLGIDAYLAAEKSAHVAETHGRQLAERLYRLLKHRRATDWPWFEDSLSYDNARLSHAMLVSGRWMNRHDIVMGGLESLEWLMDVQTSRDGYFEPVGSDAPFERGGEKPRFDQQPVEAGASASACLVAWRLTKDSVWKDRAQSAFDWFLGQNCLGVPLRDPISGGCCDGLHETRLNENQGAESTLSYMIALADLAQEDVVAAPVEAAYGFVS